MKKYLRFFPLSLSTAKNGMSLAITVLIYIVVPGVFALIASLFSKVIILNFLMKFIAILFSVYCLIGIVIALVKFFKKSL